MLPSPKRVGTICARARSCVLRVPGVSYPRPASSNLVFNAVPSDQLRRRPLPQFSVSMELSRLLSIGIIWGDRCLRRSPRLRPAHRPRPADSRFAARGRQERRAAGRGAHPRRRKGQSRSRAFAPQGAGPPRPRGGGLPGESPCRRRRRRERLSRPVGDHRGGARPRGVPGGGGEGPLRARRRRRGRRARRRVLGARGHSGTHGGVRGVRAAYGDRRPGGRLGRCGAFEDPVQAKFRESTFPENRCIKGGGTIPTVSELNGRADAKYPAGTIFGTHGDVRTVGLRQHGRLEAVPGDRSQGY